MHIARRGRMSPNSGNESAFISHLPNYFHDFCQKISFRMFGREMHHRNAQLIHGLGHLNWLDYEMKREKKPVGTSVALFCSGGCAV